MQIVAGTVRDVTSSMWASETYMWVVASSAQAVASSAWVVGASVWADITSAQVVAGAVWADFAYVGTVSGAAWDTASHMWTVTASTWDFAALNQAVQPLCGLFNKPTSPGFATVQAFQVEAKKRKIFEKNKNFGKREKQFSQFPRNLCPVSEIDHPDSEAI